MRGKQKFWKTLNSPFIIWFLSSAIITSISWTYTRWRADEEIRSLNMEYVRKLDFEIINRIQYVESTFRYLIASENSELEKEVVISKFFSCPNFPWVLYYEYKDRNFKSLLMELCERVPNSEKEELTRVISIFDSLLVDYEMKNKTFNYGEFLLKVNDIKKVRWDTLLNRKSELENKLEESLKKL